MALLLRCFLLLLAGLVLLPSASVASPRDLLLTPLATANRHPLILPFGLPYPGDGSVLEGGRREARVSLEVANTFSEEDTTEEVVFLDGELYRTALALRWGLGRDLEAGAEIPFLAHRPGFLDGFIEGFHEMFVFPNGNREDFPRDELRYFYARDDEVLLDFSDRSEGLGDIRLFGSWRFYRGEAPYAPQAALHASLKLPTGDSDDLLGSGAADVALTASIGGRAPLPLGLLGWYAHGGVLYLGDGDVLADLQQNWVGVGGLGLGWAPLEWLALRTQLDGHSAVFEGSDLPEVDAASLQLALGASFALAPQTVLDLAVGEDLVINAAPDVVFLFSLRHQF